MCVFMTPLRIVKIRHEAHRILELGLKTCKLGAAHDLLETSCDAVVKLDSDLIFTQGGPRLEAISC